MFGIIIVVIALLGVLLLVKTVRMPNNFYKNQNEFKRIRHQIEEQEEPIKGENE